MQLAVHTEQWSDRQFDMKMIIMRKCHYVQCNTHNLYFFTPPISLNKIGTVNWDSSGQVMHVCLQYLLTTQNLIGIIIINTNQVTRQDENAIRFNSALSLTATLFAIMIALRVCTIVHAESEVNFALPFLFSKKNLCECTHMLCMINVYEMMLFFICCSF